MPATKAARRKPAWKEAEEREARRFFTRVKSRRRKARRYAVVYDIDGPHIRLGFVWFVIAVAALVVGRVALTPLYGVTAAVAGNQTAVAWRARGQRPDRFVSTMAAGAIGAAGAVSTIALGAAIVVSAVAAVAAAQVQRTRRPWIADAGYTVQCSLFVGLAVAGLLTASRYEAGTAVALVLLVSAYETGDYIVGSGARNSIEGPLAGFAAIVVVTFCVAALAIPPFDSVNALAFGALAAGLCPIGQLVASAILPSATAKASALRRLDSLLVLGPVWALTVGVYLPKH
jgi:hypothetical protein